MLCCACVERPCMAWKVHRRHRVSNSNMAYCELQWGQWMYVFGAVALGILQSWSIMYFSRWVVCVSSLDSWDRICIQLAAVTSTRKAACNVRQLWPSSVGWDAQLCIKRVGAVGIKVHCFRLYTFWSTKGPTVVEDSTIDAAERRTYILHTEKMIKLISQVQVIVNRSYSVQVRRFLSQAPHWYTRKRGLFCISLFSEFIGLFAALVPVG